MNWKSPLRENLESLIFPLSLVLITSRSRLGGLLAVEGAHPGGPDRLGPREGNPPPGQPLHPPRQFAQTPAARGTARA